MSRYKIVKMDREISNKKVDSYKNFDALLHTYKKSKFYKRLFITTVMSIIIGASIIYFYPSDENESIANRNQVDNEQDGVEMLKKATSSIDTLTKSREDELARIELIKQDRRDDVAKEKTIETSPKVIQHENEAKSIVIQQETSFKKAYPKYGLDSLFNYFHLNIKNNTTTEIRGNLIVAFTIDASGAPGSIQIIQSLANEIDNEIIRLVSEMPEWQPAVMNGKAVSSTCTLPIEISTHPINN